MATVTKQGKREQTTESVGRSLEGEKNEGARAAEKIKKGARRRDSFFLERRQNGRQVVGEPASTREVRIHRAPVFGTASASRSSPGKTWDAACCSRRTRTYARGSRLSTAVETSVARSWPGADEPCLATGYRATVHSLGP
ncbi:hypothetical protein MRX96_037967 [Rhipicephalus microplus]